MRPWRLAVAAGVMCGAVVAAQTPSAIDWRYYGGDAGSRKYSAAAEIAAGNVSRLAVAWQWPSIDNAVVDANPTARPGAYQDTPLMANGMLYTVTSLGQIAALDPATGRARWTFDPGSWKTGRPGNLGFVHRGLAYWSDGPRARLLLATGDAYLIAVDAATGALDADFGDGGKVDLMAGVARAMRGATFSNSSAPIVSRGVVVVGASVHDGPTTKEWPRGDVTGYDVRTGRKLWTFRSIPEKGAFGHDTWSGDAAEYTGSTNVWTTMSADDELGLVYLPFGTPTNDFYGGHRPGANLFAESIVAVDVTTGARRWHYQAVHHGLWDYDLPAAPTLVDITVNGRAVKALAQVSKQGFTYVLDRRTGEPVWPIEERAVPPSNAPGERTSPTQPFPSKPPAFERQGMTDDNLIDFTPELRARAVELLAPFERGPLFTPPSEKGTVVLPGWVGGANWGGAAFDPESGRLFVPSMTSPIVVQLVRPDGEKSNFQLLRGGQMNAPTIDGLPLTKPPYGRVTALDLHQGTEAWMVPVGEGPRRHPRLAALNLPPLGMQTRGNPLVTKTLLFIAQGGGPLGAPPPGSAATAAPPETRKIRAFDKQDGRELWAAEPPISGAMASPMTYVHQGRQYVVVAAGGGVNAGLVAWALGPS
ncbi:MAG: pyrroloquinoline quinone-dependent dehydrogenase [Acidobacteria bacterium]|nr:pyrroloquinoline quinone-dependent dehydrogenase [Acidobacteriota bacterium]